MIEKIIGKTLESFSMSKDIYHGSDIILLNFTDGSKLKMWHGQDCCEDVYIESITGDFERLIGNPILVAEKRESDVIEHNGDYDEMWTFYCIRNIKESVDIRWYGTSNGYYSISVSEYFKESENEI